MNLTDEQKHIILEIDMITKQKTVETDFALWTTNIGVNSRNLGNDRKPLSQFWLHDSRNKDVLVIIGPGASMRQYADKLHALRRECTICTVPTALQWTIRHGLYPDFVVMQDSRQKRWLFKGVTAPVLAPTTGDPGILEDFDCYLFTLMHGNGLIDPVFGSYNEWSLLIDSDLDGGVYSMGCVHNMAVELVLMLKESGQLRWKRIVFLGCDFGGWNGLIRVPMDGGDDWQTNDDGDEWWIHWNGFWTDPRMIWYKWKLLRMWARTEAPIYSLSHGLLHEFPSVTFDHALTGKFRRYYKKKYIERKFQEYSALMADTFPREEA